MSNRVIARADLCSAINISDSSLRKYISRGSITEIKKGFVDIDDDMNRAYILSYASKKGIDFEAWLSKQGEQQEKFIEFDHEDIPKSKKDKPKKTYTELQVIKTEKEVAKLEIDTRLKILELEKKKAKVLPLEFVIEWSALNIRGVFGETVNFGNSMIEQICNNLDADVKTKLEYKKKFKQGFNEILRDGIKKQKPEAISQAKEYSLLTNKW